MSYGDAFEISFNDIMQKSVNDIRASLYTKGQIKVVVENMNQITVYVDEGSNITLYSGPHNFNSASAGSDGTAAAAAE